MFTPIYVGNATVRETNETQPVIMYTLHQYAF